MGTLGFAELGEALAARPAQMVSLSPEQWELLGELHRGGAYRQEFQAAWQNGVAFLAATDGLRGRVPLQVEWRGGQRQPGDEPVPADLRIDHVFLVSCKYLSRIVSNSSPASVFDRLLAGGHGGRSGDWFAEVAPEAYQDLYLAVRDHACRAPDNTEAIGEDIGERDGVGGGEGAGAPGLSQNRGSDPLPRPHLGSRPELGSIPDANLGPRTAAEPSPGLNVGLRRNAELDLPEAACDLTVSQRTALQKRLGRGQWAPALRPAAARFADAVAAATATRWQKALADADLERVLWRLLRIGSTPYFVLGASAQGSLRLRIGTAWDWRQHYRIEDFTVTPAGRAQPVVEWQVAVAHRRSTQVTTVEGHVEIRWSHGKFAQPPEAKVYLDTPHHRIPGYWPLG